MTRPAMVTVGRVVAWLTANGYRPEPARAMADHAAWGAPDYHEAVCPLCDPAERSLRVEAWGLGVITFCVNAACPSWQGASTEQHVHDRVWLALVDRGITKPKRRTQ